MLRIIVAEVIQQVELCSFIHGLDEFEGNHRELIDLLKDITQYPNIKICVATWPWLVFEEAFEYKPSFMLQDLTYSDTKHFVISSLQDK